MMHGMIRYTELECDLCSLRCKSDDKPPQGWIHVIVDHRCCDICPSCAESKMQVREFILQARGMVV